MIYLPLKHKKAEQGSVLLMALMFLVILSVLGIAGIQRANTDLMISRNYKDYKENFYLTDGAAYEAVQNLDSNASARVESLGWMFQEADYPGGEALKGGHAHWNNATSASFSSDTEYIVYKDRNDTAGVSRFRVFARSTKANSNVLIEIMYEITD